MPTGSSIARRDLMTKAVAGCLVAAAGLAVATPGRAQDINIIIAPREPPRPRYEAVPPYPRGRNPGELDWDPGHWEWRRDRWFWNAGRWQERPVNRRRARWVRGHWEQHPRGWRWFHGRWAD